jgi:hypothetical protein
MTSLYYHRAVVGDPIRRKAQIDAIGATVREGDVVADVGAGTGLLAMYAVRAGAKKVYAIERDESAQLARQIVRDNGMSDRIEVIQADATTVQLPEKVDVLLGDVVGVLGVDLHIMGIYAHMVATQLKAGGRVIPATIDVSFAPWEAPELYAPIAFWKQPIDELDFSSVLPFAVNGPYSQNLPPEGALAEAQTYWNLRPPHATTDALEATHVHTITRAGTVHGIGGWFGAELAPGVRIDTAPSAPTTVWRQGFLPIDDPLSLQPGDTLELSIGYTPEPSGTLIGWKGELRRNGDVVARFRQHEFLGTLYALHKARQ